jgi:hypothetical protein
MFSNSKPAQFLGREVVSVADGLAGKVIQEIINLAGKTTSLCVNLENGRIREGTPEQFRLSEPVHGGKQNFDEKSV